MYGCREIWRPLASYYFVLTSGQGKISKKNQGILRLIFCVNHDIRGYTEGVCSMAVPAMSTSALQMPSIHPAIRNVNHR